MHVGRGILEAGVLGGNEGLNVMQHFIIHLVEAWFESPGGKITVSDLVGTEVFFLRPIFYGYQSNEVGVINIEDDKVRIASIGRDGEAAGLIGENPTSSVGEGHVDEIGEIGVAGSCKKIIGGVVVEVDGEAGGVEVRSGA